MADDQDSSKFKLDLDQKEFIENALKAKEAISAIGESKNLEGLIGGIAEAGVAIGVLGAAFFAIKGVVEAVFDAERIETVNAQFNALSTNAGVFSEDLKKGLEDASRGWVDQVSLMEAANRSLTQFQTGAEKIPELMDLARRSTLVMGGDLISNFNSISQAVASGNARQLRHLGIIVDQQKAYRDYAQSIGVTVESLNQAGRQQSIMDAALAEGKKKFSDQNTDLQQNIHLWEQFKVLIIEIKDTVVLAIDRIAGPILAKYFTGLKEMASDAKTWLQANYGAGAEAAAAKTELLKDKVIQLKAELIDIEQKKLHGFDVAPGETAARLQGITKQLKDYEDQLKSADAVSEKFHEEQKAQAEAMEGTASGGNTADLEKVRAQQAEHASQMAAIDRQIVDEQLKNMETVEEAEEFYNEKKYQESIALQDKIAEVYAKMHEGKITAAQADEQVVALDRLNDLKMIESKEELYRYQEQALKRYVAESHSAAEGIGRAFEAQAKKSALDMQNFGAQGTKAVGSFASHATDSMKAWGAGTKNATQAVTGMFAGMAGDMASDYGQMMMLASIWPPNPIAFAAGAALVALGGYLGSLGGGSSSAVSTGGAGGDSGGLNSGGSNLLSGAAGQTEKKAVTLQIMGHYYDTEQTKTRLMDLIRDATDATDFKYVQIGST